jgi:hypothetical protein
MHVPAIDANHDSFFKWQAVTMSILSMWTNRERLAGKVCQVVNIVPKVSNDQKVIQKRTELTV